MEFPPRSVAITQVADCGVRAVGAAQLNSRPMVKGERFLSDVRHVAHHSRRGPNFQFSSLLDAKKRTHESAKPRANVRAQAWSPN
jgi:hypothetical protein